jgi:hypothetical protein
MIPDLILLAKIVVSQPQVALDQSPTPAVKIVSLTQKSLNMENRYDDAYVNGVFKDNILLAVHYMAGDIKFKQDIDWSKIESPFTTEFVLNPGEEFAFHEHVLPNYSKNLVKTMNTNFNWAEGYKSDGFLVGDGVCHLASIMYWAALDAGITTYAPSNHNFAKINDVPKEYGVAIESPLPMGNLYITNNKDKPLKFRFAFNGDKLNLEILEESN